MTLTTRLLAARKGATLGSAALALAMLGSNGAWAQCTDNFNFFAFVGGQPRPVQELLPLGRGSSVSAFVSTINAVNTAFLTNTSAFVSAPGGPQPDQQGGGVWVRGIAGTVDTETTSTGILNTSGVAAPTPPATGRQTCHTTTRQDYAGFQVGHDISILNGGGTGANWHWGVTAGYLEARTKDITPAGSFFQPEFGGVLLHAGGDLPRRYPGALRGDLHRLHQGELLLRRSAALRSLSEQPLGLGQRSVRPIAQCARSVGDRQRRLQHSARLRLVHRAVGRLRVVACGSRSAQCIRAGECRRRVCAGHRDDRRYRQSARSRQRHRRHQLHALGRRLATLLYSQRVQ